MADLRQLRADIVASVLAKCLEAITNCYIKLEVNGLLTVTIDSNGNLEIPVSAVCHKEVSGDNNTEKSPPEADSTNKTEIIQHNTKFANLPNAISVSDLDLDISTKCEPSNGDSCESDDVEPGNCGLYSHNSHLSASLLTESYYSNSLNQGYESNPPVFQHHPMDINSMKSNEIATNVLQQETEPFQYHKFQYHKYAMKPRKKRPSIKRKQYSSEAIMNAYRKVVEDNVSISAAAKLFGVPRTTLSDKLQGHVPLVHGNYKVPNNTVETQSSKESISTAGTELSCSADLPIRNIKIEKVHSE